MKLIIFLLVNIIGFFITGVLITYTLHNTTITELPVELRMQIWPYINPGIMLAWMFGSALSILYLFVKQGVKYLFLAMPIVSSIIYLLYILNTFSI